MLLRHLSHQHLKAVHRESLQSKKFKEIKNCSKSTGFTINSEQNEKEDVIQLLKGDYRTARVKTEPDRYLAEESDLCRGLEQFEYLPCGAGPRKDALEKLVKCID